PPSRSSTPVLSTSDGSATDGGNGTNVSERKSILLRLDPAGHDAPARGGAHEVRSTNAQIEFLLRRALADAGRLPTKAGEMRRPGRPRSKPAERRDYSQTMSTEEPPRGAPPDAQPGPAPEPEEASQPRRRGFRTGRLEAFSDGVFAIAVTLLI